MSHVDKYLVQFRQKFGFKLCPKSAEKAPFFTQLKAAILISLFGKNPQNNESGVYENLALFWAKMKAAFGKSVSVSRFVLVYTYILLSIFPFSQLMLFKMQKDIQYPKCIIFPMKTNFNLDIYLLVDTIQKKILIWISRSFKRGASNNTISYFGQSFQFFGL